MLLNFISVHHKKRSLSHLERKLRLKRRINTTINLKDKTDELISLTKAAFQSVGKPSLEFVWKQTQLFIGQIIKEIQIQVGNAIAGPEKKQAALTAAGIFFDTTIVGSLLIPYVPNFLQTTALQYSKPIFLLLVGGTIDALVNIFQANKVNGFQTQSPSGSDNK